MPRTLEPDAVEAGAEVTKKNVRKQSTAVLGQQRFRQDIPCDGVQQMEVGPLFERGQEILLFPKDGRKVSRSLKLARQLDK